MYSSIIEIKKSVSGEALRKLRETAEIGSTCKNNFQPF